MSPSKKPKTLVIVESASKVGNFSRWLGDDYIVEASLGHVLDLPKSGLGVDVENGFEPQYQVIRGKGAVLQKLRAAAKKADRILLATDPDREGEAIAFHIALKLGYEKDDGSRFLRVKSNEITETAVREAVAHPGDIDLRKVDAQQARRLLDRLVGYGLSPLLWRKISPKDPISGKPLSAGRVQSVAVRLTVERERERRRFRRATYWDMKAVLESSGRTFEARLVSLGGRRLAGGKDFDRWTGLLKEGVDVAAPDAAALEALAGELADLPFRVTGIREEKKEVRPSPPFTTATLQQEANRKLNLSARDTMRIAQRLYEAGHITYMRTDSVHLSTEAIEAARRRIRRMYGPDYLPSKPRTYRTKSRGAQEAHEAIRPAGVHMPTSGELRLAGVDQALFDLVWKRTLASQMRNAVERTLTAQIAAGEAGFRASGKVVEFPGFYRAYVEGSDDPEAELGRGEVLLPKLAAGDEVELRELDVLERQTRPPDRYTEATLVGALEAEGVGRPSTYATILQTVVERGYVQVRNKALIPTFTGFAVIQLLERHFPDLVDLGFTASMEEALDLIAEGEIDWHEYLAGFYSGEKGFAARLEREAERIEPREASTVVLDGPEATVRIGRYGPFVEADLNGEPVMVSIPPDLPPAELTEEKLGEMVERKVAGRKSLGSDPKTGLPVFCLDGRYGPYVQLGELREGEEKPRRASLPRGWDPSEMTLERALGLLSLPRELGSHPETGEPVRAGIGRYGPYVVHDGEFRSLGRDEDVLTVGLERALELLAQPKSGRRRTPPKPLRVLGPHPADGEPVHLMRGRYGPYVRHGKTNASLPRALAPERVTLEEAVELLAARAARGPSRRGGRRRKGGGGRGAS